MQELWENAGLESIDTRVICISVVFSDFDDFWDFEHCANRAAGEINRWHVNERKGATPHAYARPPAYRFRWTYRLRIICERREGTGAGATPLMGASGMSTMSAIGT